MKKIIISAICFLSVCPGGNVVAQSLNELIRTALEHNYNILIVRNEAEMAANSNTSGNAGKLPTVNAAAGYSNSYTNTKQLFADGTIREGSSRNTSGNASVMVNWTVFNGFRVYAMQDKLNQLEKLGNTNARFYIEQTISDLVLVYQQLVYQKQLLDNYTSTLEVSKFRLDLELKRKEVGSGKLLDYGQALVDYQSDSMRLLAQKLLVKNLETDINRILGTELGKEVTIKDHRFEIQHMPGKDSILQMMLNRNENLDQAKISEKLAEIEARILRAEQFPKIDLYGGYQVNRNTAQVGFTKSNQSFGPVFGVNVQFALYSGGTKQIEVENAIVANENALLTRQMTEQSLKAEAIKLYNTNLSLLQRMDLAYQNVEMIKKVSETAKDQLAKGGISGYDFRLTQLSYFNAMQTLMELKYLLKSSEIGLNRISGETLNAYLAP